VLRAVRAQNPVLAARCLEDEPDAGTAAVDEILLALVRAMPADALPSSPEGMAVAALTGTTWAPVLQDHLLRELRSRGPVSVPSLGRLIGRALRPTSDQDLDSRRTSLVAGLQADGEQPLIAALIFGALADDRDDPVMLPVTDLLARLQGPDPILAAAAAWVMSVTQPPSGGGWWPTSDDIDSIVALAPTGEAERMTLLSLIDAVGPRRWPAVLETLGEAARDRTTAVRGEAVRLLGYVDQEVAIPTILAAIAEGEADVREDAANGLRWLRSSAAGPALMAALDDEVPDVRRAAAHSLGLLGESTATRKLLAAAEDPDMGVRYDAVQALGMIGESTVVTPLLGKLGLLEKGRSWRLIDALHRIGDDRVIPVLVDAFDRLPEASLPWAFYTFGEISDRRALVVVRQYLTREVSGPAWEWAVSAMGRLAEAEPADRRMIDSALTSDQAEVRREAVDALGFIGDYEARERLTEIITDGSAEVRCAAANALAQSDCESALAAAGRLAADESPVVRVAGMKAVSSGCTELGYGILATGLLDHDPQVREAAAVSLQGYDSGRARSLLVSASFDPVAQVRTSVARALREPYSRSVAGTLLRLAGDRDPDVRAAATESLGRSGGRALCPGSSAGCALLTRSSGFSPRPASACCATTGRSNR
jgi:HEAT repeat protein